MKDFNIFATVTISIITLLCGGTLTYYYFLYDTILYNETIWGSYISGLGSFLGGLFGGLVAFMVAKAQVWQEDRKNRESSKNRFNNILKLLIVEVNHNIDIFKIMNQSGVEGKLSNSLALEDQVWNEVKFNIISDLKEDFYKVLNNHFRECKDIKLKVLPDYQNLEKVDLTIRIKTAEKIVKDLEGYLK